MIQHHNWSVRVWVAVCGYLTVLMVLYVGFGYIFSCSCVTPQSDRLDFDRSGLGVMRRYYFVESKMDFLASFFAPILRVIYDWREERVNFAKDHHYVRIYKEVCSTASKDPKFDSWDNATVVLWTDGITVFFQQGKKGLSGRVDAPLTGMRSRVPGVGREPSGK